jgi:lipid-A-disaccharide synthase
MTYAPPPAGEHPLVFISAAEPSADLHGAWLIRATLDRCPSVRFVGVAGPRMVEAGCESIFNMIGESGMLLGAVGALRRGVAMLRTCERHLRRYAFDAAVVIDSPTLHLPLAAKAQAAGVPVMYYIAPQMWAWGAYRVRKLRDRVDRVAVIFPFEEKYFRDQGVNATYVGHPLAEQFAHVRVDEAVVGDIRACGTPVVALFPGSRKHVVREVLRGQLEVAERIAAALPGASFPVSVGNPHVAPLINKLLASCRASVKLYPANHTELVRAADLVLVASGTMALEAAFHERPMIVMYNASRLFYHLIGRWMIHTPYLSLPNILAGRQVVPEFMPYYTSTTPIAQRAIELLRSESQRQAMVNDLRAVVTPLKGRSASQRAAAMLLDMIGK